MLAFVDIYFNKNFKICFFPCILLLIGTQRDVKHLSVYTIVLNSMFAVKVSEDGSFLLVREYSIVLCANTFLFTAHTYFVVFKTFLNVSMALRPRALKSLLHLNLLSLVNREDTTCKRLMGFSPFAFLTRRLAIRFLYIRNCSVLFTICFGTKTHKLVPFKF